MQLKCRQIERTAEAVPVDRQELKPGDKVVCRGRPYVVRQPDSDFFAANLLFGSGDSLLGGPIYRIHNIRQDETGRWHWDRVVEKPEEVALDELKPGDWFTADGPDGSGLFVRCNNGDRIVAILLRSGQQAIREAFLCDTLYRARIVGFEDGELLWETY